ncbi:MAG: hypothetical protein M1819_005996 [Sarea resinae]|nr:MAG: hypothetical protein M1819_005996 [Sarea resinae]
MESPAPRGSGKPKTYVVEHLDPELGPWSALEYLTIAQESQKAGVGFCLSSVPESLRSQEELQSIEGLQVEGKDVENLFADKRGTVCLLDPAATKDLSPEDGDQFSVFLFGGILGDDPPRDRTSELRAKGFEGRRLGPKQMTTDTAVRVTRMVTQDKIPLQNLQYIDCPEIKINKHESVEMPFRYVKSEGGQPIMPQGMVDLIKKDSEKGFEGFLE